ncbi:MAG: WYL domain-containing protein [Lachnospiraceae bacterium]|nr:WYL domain-containing protein [Lachnospiraceae bacterium]
MSDSSNRLTSLYILFTLKQYSNKEHPLSIADIIDKINETFKIEMHRSTISRTLDTLCSTQDFPFNIDLTNYTDSFYFGFGFYCVVKDITGKWKEYDPLLDIKKGNSKGQKKYYFYESVFSDAEIITLIDAIETYNYFSNDNILALVQKLRNLRPMSKYNTPINSRAFCSVKTQKSRIFENIDILNKIIQKNQFAEITYCNYNYNQKLEIRPKYPRTIKPLHLMWSNGYYYLIAILNSKYEPAHLRIDRIIDVNYANPNDIPNTLKDIPKKYEFFDASNYRLEHPVMFSGKKEAITMLCRDTLDSGIINAIVDTFGQLADMRPVTENKLKQYLPPNETDPWIEVRISAAPNGVALFATQYCRDCKIIFPSHLVEKIKNNLNAGLSLYQ